MKMQYQVTETKTFSKLRPGWRFSEIQVIRLCLCILIDFVRTFFAIEIFLNKRRGNFVYKNTPIHVDMTAGTDACTNQEQQTTDTDPDTLTLC